MNIILFDTEQNWKNLLPLTYTRPISEIRIGILRISEKWKKYLTGDVSYITQNYLQEKYPFSAREENILINSSLLPDKYLSETIKNLPLNSILKKNNILLAAHTDNEGVDIAISNPDSFNTIEYNQEISMVNNLWDIFLLNGKEIEKDFKLITAGRQSAPLSDSNKVFQPERIFVEPGAKAEAAIINPAGGYIYIGKDAEIMEGAIIRGSLAMCEHSVIKMGAKIYGPTTLGPYSKVGGEVNNSVIIGYSNKAHDGFLGNSVLGEWCNIGADSNNSNLKNNYAQVKLWNYGEEKFVSTQQQFCGLFMGDHSKCGINTMFNTGTVVGVSCNIFGAGFPRKFIPSFSWGGPHGYEEYLFDKAMETARRVMARRNKELTDKDIAILKQVFDMSKKYRNF